MDLKVDVEDCDPLIEVTVMSAKEIEVASTAVAATPGISSDIRDVYARAKNRLFAPALARVWADQPGGGTVVILLATRELSQDSAL